MCCAVLCMKYVGACAVLRVICSVARVGIQYVVLCLLCAACFQHGSSALLLY